MNIDVYPVGTLMHLRSAYRLTRLAVFALRQAAAASAGHIRHRQWHELRQEFNGYLAEPTPFPDGMARCGSGWTRRRALRSLQRHARRPGVQWEAVDRAVTVALGESPPPPPGHTQALMDRLND